MAITRLTVLSTRLDPYRRDTTDGHRDGQWFADQIAPLPPNKKIHLRGLFYRVVSAGNIRRPDGSLFINDHDCSKWLPDTAAKAARWLGHIPFERIIDNRNDPPLVISYVETPQPGSVGLSVGRMARIERSEEDLLPSVASARPVARQPYRIVQIGEKSSLAEVLEPIARLVKGELLLPSGEMSDTMIAEMAARAAADPARPWCSISAISTRADGRCRSHFAQAAGVAHAPSSGSMHYGSSGRADSRSGARAEPAVDTAQRDRKARQQMARGMGHEQTEIDALAALRPEELTRIALDALKPFFDFTLDERCERAATDSFIAAHRKLAAHPAMPALSETIRTAHQGVEAALEVLEDAQCAALSQLQEGDDGIKDVPVAVPEVTIDATPPAPLFTTADDFVTATRKLIADKALAPDEDGGAH